MMKESDAINPTDNAHLAQEYLEALDGASTKYRRRFFEGTFVEEIEDALWTYDRLDACRVSLDEVPDLQRIVVAIDPSGARGPEDTRSDEIGIIVAGKGVDGLCYVLEDLTIRDKPEVRARRACTPITNGGRTRSLAKSTMEARWLRPPSATLTPISPMSRC